MNDLGYRCLAHAIAEEIEGAAGSDPRPTRRSDLRRRRKLTFSAIREIDFRDFEAPADFQPDEDT